MVCMEVEIRSALLYEFKLGRKATEAAPNIRQAFREDTVRDRKAQF